MTLFYKKATNRFIGQVTSEGLNQWIPQALRAIGVNQIEIDEQRGGLSVQFEVSEKNMQPHRVLHGGVSALIGETLASIGGNLCVDETQAVVGQTLTASHLRPVPFGGRVKGFASPIHLGKKSQVWNVDLTNDDQQLICRISMTLAVIPLPK